MTRPTARIASRQFPKSKMISPHKIACLLGCCLMSAAAAEKDWAVYLGDSEGSHYSRLDQINRSNVGRLEKVWEFHTGDATPTSQMQCNAIVIDGVLYGTSAQHKLFALDAATGHQLWTFDPFQSEPGARARGVNRGVAMWRDAKERRLLFAAGAQLHAIDPATGKLIETFGRGGRVDLREGLDRDVSGLFMVGTTPGAVFEDLIIVSTRVGEGPGPAAPGHIRAYDVRTGERRWIFKTIPWPGEPGYETWSPQSWKDAGGANCWAGLVIDHQRGIAFVPTGSPAYDFWGGNRVGDNLFSNCLLALDARTGKLRWHFQFVRHDVWDRDLPAAPVLCEVTRNGRRTAAVAQTTKSGHVWVFDRETGESLFPWRDMEVPGSDIPGEALARTQPMPLAPAPFARQQFTPEEATDLSPASRAGVLEELEKLTPHVQFAPPSRRGTIVLPGLDGGGEWGGPAVDPSGVLYVNGNEMAFTLHMIPARSEGAGLGETLYRQLCMACHGADRSGNAPANIPGVLNLASRMKSADVETVIKTGRGVMPSFNFLTDSQRHAITRYLLGEESTIAATPPAGTPDRVSDPSTQAISSEIPYTVSGYNRFLDKDGYPALRPPWGTLNAIDLNTGKYVWRRPLGEYKELSARGIPPTGTENYGGPIVTAGGLVFIAASRDEMIRAFDRDTGEELWRSPLPAGGYATPSTYMVGDRQYVVIACGGGKMGTKSGDSYVAFALPASAGSRQQGHLRVNISDELGQPLPARAWLEDESGERFFRPLSTGNPTPYQQDRSFSADGSFNFDLPAGRYLLHVERGKEYISSQTPVEITSGQSTTHSVELRRWIDMPKRGYFSADLHVHFGHDRPEVLAQLSLADDVNLVPAFSYWYRGNEAAWASDWPDWAKPTQRRLDATHIVTTNNVEIERILRRNDADVAPGAAFLFNLERPSRAESVSLWYPTTADLVSNARCLSPSLVADLDKSTWGESVVGVALGLYDTVQVCHNHFHRRATLPGGWGMIVPFEPDEKDLREPDELFHRTNKHYYHWLNCGIRLGVSGGSAMGVMPVPLGYSRTYALVSGEFTPENFWKAVKAGRTFATSGPMLILAADGKPPGSALTRASPAAPVAISVEVHSMERIEALELIERGAVIQRETARLEGPFPFSRTLSWTVTPERSTWYAVRALFRASDGRIRQAHTSPVYVTLDGTRIASRTSAEYMIRWVDFLINAAATPGRFRNDEEKERTLATYMRARHFYDTVAKSASD